jgi:ABC-type lipoprotein export system ATPase subunit
MEKYYNAGHVLLSMETEPIQCITILPGHDRNGVAEPFERIDINPGDTISIVGPTGSGKTAFINDIEVFACGDTITGRTILVNNRMPPESFVRDPSKKPIAMITQNTKCLSDLTVREFLAMHVQARGITKADICTKTLALANEFTGEKMHLDMRMTGLSGGQTRALMVADAVLISNAPVILLDEVENAGIFKDRVISCLKSHGKAVIFVTHDPLVSLLSDRRIVMSNGSVERVLTPNGNEREALSAISRIDALMGRFRERIRAGELLTGPVGTV